jgi:uracil-DNA glycosylase
MFRIVFDRKCNLCPLSTGQAVAGQSECEPEQVKLIIVSAYPGINEVQQNLSLAPATSVSKNKLSQTAGEFLRMTLEEFFDKDPRFNITPLAQYTFFTNILKCKTDKETKPDYINTCKQYFYRELSYLPPHVPILIAGTEPRQALFPQYKSLKEARGRVDSYNKHPVVFTENPINIERGLLYLPGGDYNKIKSNLLSYISQCNNNNQLPSKVAIKKIINPSLLVPPLPGQALHTWFKDMSLIKNLLMEN